MLIGREKETNYLKSTLMDQESHFIAVYGRRRIGKTFLVRQSFDGRFTFEHSGLSNAKTKEQLQAFSSSLNEAGLSIKKRPNNWLEAFDYLKELIKKSNEKKKIIFIDELSWMDNRGSDLITALENFWNAWASKRSDIVLIVCSSATSWILSNVIHNKGGLYNRLTGQIQLKEFSLYECEEFVKSKNLILNHEQILEYYMIFGGVPYYWNFIEKGLGITQNIDRILFAEDAILKDEFKYLFASIFKKPEVHIKIVETLATKKIGMTRNEIIENANINNSGDLSKKLEELEYCGFIRKINPFKANKKNAIYQLIDHFTLFYYQFIKQHVSDENFWTNQINTPKVNTWKGLAYERICLNHIKQIKRKLGISGVLTNVNSWSCKKDDELGLFGSQIDLLLVRNDQIINLCEIKYYKTELKIDEKLNTSINHKINDFMISTKTRYSIHPTIITTVGLIDNEFAKNIQSVIVLNDLFEKDF